MTGYMVPELWCNRCHREPADGDGPDVTPEVLSVGAWATNAELVAEVAALGWLTDDMDVLDATYGKGNFWTEYRPPRLVGIDLNPAKSDPLWGPMDFRDLAFADRSFDAVVFDPPYKLNGTPSLDDFDTAYGIEAPTNWRDRMALILDGAAECARVAKRHLLVKCQDQVVSGQMRWQTDAVTDVVTSLGFRKADRFDFGALKIADDDELEVKRGRSQPPGRSQVHARHNASQLLVFTRGRVDNGSRAAEGAA